MYGPFSVILMAFSVVSDDESPSGTKKESVPMGDGNVFQTNLTAVP